MQHLAEGLEHSKLLSFPMDAPGTACLSSYVTTLLHSRVLLSLEGVRTPGCFAFEVVAQRQPCKLIWCLYFTVLHSTLCCETSPSLPQTSLILPKCSALFLASPSWPSGNCGPCAEGSGIWQPDLGMFLVVNQGRRRNWEHNWASF